jgi:hypothetical protein
MGPSIHDGRKNEFNALIAAMMAAKICESDSPCGEGLRVGVAPALTIVFTTPF